VTVSGTDLERFVAAQASVFAAVCRELASGQKKSHWMWFVFPQLAGLGMSPTSQRFALASLSEAQDYLHHPVLGPRLEECTGLVNAVQGRTVHEIFGYPDNLKFRSSMTLFVEASGYAEPFETALRKYFAGEADPRTLELLRRGAGASDRAT
jgi:uncharacterized protein (DUF1810 family)